MNLPDYFNTNREVGHVLAQSTAQAKDQRLTVLAFFQAHPHTAFAPHQIPMPAGTPLTSIRRAVTNLTEQGLLEKTDEMVQGTFGKRVHQWKLRSQEPEQLTFEAVAS